MKPRVHFFMILGLLLVCGARRTMAMIIGGSIAANNVNVINSVTISSVTASSATVTSLLDVSNAITNLPGVGQISFSSTTIQTNTTSLSYVNTMLQAGLTLHSATSYVRITVMGVLSVGSPSDSYSYLTIFRDSTDLGNTGNNSGMIVATTNWTGLGSPYQVPVGITFLDRPGDISAHAYRVAIRSSATLSGAAFPFEGIGYFLLEEIQH